MVEERVSDPTRIAELLTAELTGRTHGSLGDVRVVDADRSARSDDETIVSRIEHEDPSPADGRSVPADTTVGTIRLVGSAVSVTLEPAATDDVPNWNVDGLPTRDRSDFDLERTERQLRLSIDSGAAVKPAIDVIDAVMGHPSRFHDP